MAQVASANWRRRGWLVMLRARERPRLTRRWTRYMRALSRTKFEPASVLLERDDASNGHLVVGSIAREEGYPFAFVVAVLRMEQDELFREILMWL